MAFIPHTVDDKKQMLEAIGVKDTNDLFDEIPSNLFTKNLSTIPEGLNEMTLMRLAQEKARLNENKICFMGAGSYEHHIPAAVWDIASRGEFLTAYTPYQAEASQGTLQLLYEFQTMISEVTGLEVANASLYDGATALAEAILMAIRLNKKKSRKKILCAGTLHPFYRQTIETIVGKQSIIIDTLPIHDSMGITDNQQAHTFDKDAAAIIIQQPNFFGTLEEVNALTDWAHAHDILVIGCVNPISLGIIAPPGEWGEQGADICCGEGQPFGAPMASGGPYFGFLSTKQSNVRQLPGRLIGQTTDEQGNIGYSLTLQAREQHIRRGKATSNICTNQGLLVTAATIHMALMGPQGLEQLAITNYVNTHKLVTELLEIEGVELAFDAPYFNEALLVFEKPMSEILQALEHAGINGGFQTMLPTSNREALLVCVTEMRTDKDIALYIKTIKQCMS